MRIAFQCFRSILLILSCLVILYSSPLRAEENGGERIMRYVSDISIHADASADIKEIIQVVALGQQIRHGIYRDLWGSFTDHSGKLHRVRYLFREISVNGYHSPFSIVGDADRLRVYIGSSDELLSPGTYTYTLSYHVTNVIGFLAERDEFYWNITGNQWRFPMEEVEANIYWPKGASLSHEAAYTGKNGEQGQDFSRSSVAANEISYRTTEVLDPGEGFTVLLSWPKGFLHQPTFIEQIKAELFDNKGNFIALQILVLLIFYYFFVWYWESREPPEGTIIPLFEPPLGLTPAAMRFIKNMGYDNKTYTAELVSLAVAGFLTIEEADGDFTLVKNDKPLAEASGTETWVLSQLFQNSPRVLLSNENIEVIAASQKILSDDLNDKFAKAYFVSHRQYLLPGILLALFAILALMWSSATDINEFGSIVIAMALFAGGSYFCFIKALAAAREVVQYWSIGNIWRVFYKSLGFLAVVILGLLLTYSFTLYSSMMSCLLLAAIFLVNAIAFPLLKIHTAEARKLLDQIEGFELFLTVTEQDRLERFNPPAKTPALFEKYLPYAIALDVENSWGRQFNQLLEKSSENPNTSYHPLWYSGNAWTMNSPGSFTSYLNSSLGSSIQSASISPSSGGGGFGGGSGGGGGGGGGGGW